MSDDYASKGGAPRLKSQFAGPDLRAPIKAEPKPEPVAEPELAKPVPESPFIDPGIDTETARIVGGTAPQTYPRRQVIKICHQFDLHPYPGDVGKFIFEMRPQRLFKPQGITVFGLGYCELSLDVGQYRIFHGITSAFFRNQKSYTDLLRDVDALRATVVNTYSLNAAMAEVLERLDRGTARFQPTFSTCYIGYTITLKTEGEVPEAVVLWGDSL